MPSPLSLPKRFIDGPKPPELLVSAKSIEEFQILAAIDEVSIIDLKDPSWGALSPTSADFWQQVAKRSSESNLRQPLSAALGEFDQADQCVGQLPSEFRFAKMGPGGCRDAGLLQQRWKSILNRLPKSTDLVAVAYADFSTAQSIAPIAVLHNAVDRGMTRILIDTFSKDGRTSIDHLGIDQLQTFADTAQACGVWWSLAGSINLVQVDQLLSAGIYPDCIGVRGAVCESGRANMLSQEKCQSFGLAVKHEYLI